eukprot:SAG31_NODE_7250_length_1742_cov_1.572733_1_plen_190_part_00
MFGRCRAEQDQTKDMNAALKATVEKQVDEIKVLGATIAGAPCQDISRYFAEKYLEISRREISRDISEDIYISRCVRHIHVAICRDVSSSVVRSRSRQRPHTDIRAQHKRSEQDLDRAQIQVRAHMRLRAANLLKTPLCAQISGYEEATNSFQSLYRSVSAQAVATRDRLKHVEQESHELKDVSLQLEAR